ncbi:uncharacterized protein [Ptychodera flava]|uniref:uncharacterized protein n=1 Tax=Ptychodera flava TaxID=63121 RepID=UPI00396A8522
MVVGTATAHHHGHHDHYHSNAATAVQYCSRVTELVRYLKNNFEADTGGRRKAEKILARTSQMLVPEYDDDLWKRHFERRQKHMQHGFFTPQHIPYHSLGDIALDTGQLVFDVFKDHLPEKHKLPGISLGVSSRAQENAESPSPDVTFQKFQGPSEGSKTNVKNAAVASAGFLHIKHQLQDSEDIMTAVKGGQTFDKCVKELEQTRKSLEESIHSQLSSLSTMPPVPRGKIYSRYGYPCKPVAPVKSALSMRLIMTPSPAIMNNDDDEMDMMKMSFYRSRKMLLRKLEAIHTLLCCMHNVKSRDLRSRVPLSHDTVKTYSKKDVILDHNGRPAISRPHRLANAGHAIHLDAIHSMEALSPHGHHGAGGHHSTHHHHHHHYHYHHHHTHPHTHLHPHSHPHPSVHGAGTSKHHQDAHHSGGTDRTLSMLRAVTPTQTWRKYRSNLGNRMHKEHRHDRDHRVDTWDDLLHAGHTERHGHEKDKDKLNPLSSVQHRLSSQPNPHHNQRFHGNWAHLKITGPNHRCHDNNWFVL